jgi:hypothetical protein
MEFQQSTIDEILDSEREMVRTASQRYGQYYDHALECSLFLSKFVKSIDPDRRVAATFFAHVKKHHTLALFATVRLHKVQSIMNLRQVLEAGACAAFAIANPDHKHFVDTDKHGILDPSQKLAKKRYDWLKRNYLAGSNGIDEIKKQLNQTGAHANFINAQANFRTHYEEGWFATPFFDLEDDYHVKADLWRIGSVAITLLDLFYGVNDGRNVIKFVDNFVPIFERLVAIDTTLLDELQSSDRYKRAMEKEIARRERISHSKAH